MIPLYGYFSFQLHFRMYCTVIFFNGPDVRHFGEICDTELELLISVVVRILRIHIIFPDP